jgi:hypothetical protein
MTSRTHAAHSADANRQQSHVHAPIRAQTAAMSDDEHEDILQDNVLEAEDLGVSMRRHAVAHTHTHTTPSLKLCRTHAPSGAENRRRAALLRHRALPSPRSPPRTYCLLSPAYCCTVAHVGRCANARGAPRPTVAAGRQRRRSTNCLRVLLFIHTHATEPFLHARDALTCGA